MAKTLVLGKIKLSECKCLSGKNTTFRPSSTYLLQALLCCDTGARVATFEQSVRLQHSDRALTAEVLKLTVDEGLDRGSLLLRLIQCNSDGKTRAIGEVVYESRKCTMTQVTNTNVSYSWNARRTRVCELVLGSCVPSGFVLTTDVLVGAGEALRAMVRHSYTRAYRICRLSATLPRAMVLFEDLYRYTVPEIDEVPFCEIGRYLTCPWNDSIPRSYIDNLGLFAKAVTVSGPSRHGIGMEPSQQHEWDLVCNILRLDANLTTYGSDRTATGELSEQWQMTRGVVQSLVSAGVLHRDVVSDCEDDAMSIITLARRMSAIGEHKVTRLMEFLPVICAVRGNKFEASDMQIDRSVDVRTRSLMERWNETSGCHTTVVAISSDKIDRLLDRSAPDCVCPELPSRCCFIDELSHRTLRGLVADDVSAVSRELYVSKLANLLARVGVETELAIQIAETKFKQLDGVTGGVITLSQMVRTIQLQQHEAAAQKHADPAVAPPNTLLEGTGLVEVGKVDHASTAKCVEQAERHCGAAGVPFEHMHSSTGVPYWYRAAVMVVIRGSEYLFQDHRTGVFGVCMATLLEDLDNVSLQPMHRVLSNEERSRCRRRLSAILPRPRMAPLGHSVCSPTDIVAGDWVLLKGPQTEAMLRLPGYRCFPLAKGVNLNFLKCD